MKYGFLTGNYASSTEACLFHFILDSEERSLTSDYCLTGVQNPSYLFLHPNGKTLYSVEELTPYGRVAVYSCENGQTEFLKSLPSGGADPCHLSMDDRNEYLLVSNYTSGSLSMYRLDRDGIPVKMTDHKQHTGSGPDPSRQEGAHVHFSIFLNGFVYICDLGLDTIFCYELDRAQERLVARPERAMHLPGGSGPRHLAIVPKFPDMLYCLTELSSQVIVFRKNGERYEAVQRLSCLPKGYSGKSTAAAIKPDTTGNYLFASNRGHDSIASFQIREDGLLNSAIFHSSGGRTPRDFTVFDELLAVANQDSDRIEILEIDRLSGKLKSTGINATAGKPSSILSL